MSPLRNICKAMYPDWTVICRVSRHTHLPYYTCHSWKIWKRWKSGIFLEHDKGMLNFCLFFDNHYRNCNLPAKYILLPIFFCWRYESFLSGLTFAVSIFFCCSWVCHAFHLVLYHCPRHHLHQGAFISNNFNSES